jgi:hypothetical protein
MNLEPVETAIHADRDLGRDTATIAVAVALATVYATLRYNIFKGVAWSDWPHFVGNKIVAVSALILIVDAIWRLASRDRRPIRRIMGTASLLAVVHSLMSLALLDPVYFEKFFLERGLSLAGGVSLLLGSLATALLIRGEGRRGASAPVSASLLLGSTAALVAIHAALPSVPSWLEPTAWPGGMPPLTLLSFGIGGLGVALALRCWAHGRAGRKAVSG